MRLNRSIIRLVPKTHLVAGSLSLALIGLGVLWLPANDAAAIRSETTLQLHIESPADGAADAETATAPSTPPAEPTATSPQAPESAAADLKPATSPAAEQPIPAEESWLHLTADKGDSLSTLFTQAGLGPNQLYPLLNALKASGQGKLFNRLKPGEELAFMIVDDQLRQLRYARGKSNALLIEPQPTGVTIREVAYTATPEPTQEEDAAEATAQTPAAAPIESVPDLPPESEWVKVRIARGDNLSSLFDQAGLGASQLYPMLNKLKAEKQDRLFNRLMPGEELAFLIRDGKLSKLRYIRNPLESTLIEPLESSIKVTELIRTPEVKLLYKQAEITDSLFLAGQAAGLSDTKIMELANIFGWDVDFALDIRQGDRFDMIYEERYLDGQRIGEGSIVAASFTNQGHTFEAIRYTDSQGDSNYYTPDGHSMRKAFLRTPVDFARISSRFNPNRKHPIFKTNRPHRGVDYAAPTGTPIKSSGDGKVILAGRKGGYGKTVIIQHGQKYTTLYAHMSRIKPGMRNGKRVKQGEVIGYVGSTGYATGPHLHYEFRVNGVHRNPLTVKLPQAEPLPKRELATFKPLAAKLLAQLEMHQQTQLARQ